MTNWVELTNFVAACCGMVVVLLCLLLNLTIPSCIEGWNRRFFTVFFSLMAAYVASDLLSQVSLELLGPGWAELSRAAIFCESLFSSLLMPLLTMHLMRCAGRDCRKSPGFFAVSTLWFSYFALLIITQFTTHIYFVTAENLYFRGPWYPVLLIPPALLMLLNLAVLLRFRAALTPRQCLAFAIYLGLPLVCMLIQMRSYGLLMIVIGTSVSAFFLFLFMLLDQVERYVAQQKELAAHRAGILVLQMRPHLIYNTMMSIYYLIRQDPGRAQQVTLDFTSYLRRNFTAIVKEGTVPFSEELEHTRAYLAVETVRFENTLFVEMDTPVTLFRVPPLTLQPIVENAVKHGVSPDLDPLHLSVLTRETDRGSEIIVEDTGPGFSAADDNEPHIALANIRDRLKLLCRGTLEIAPREGGGTRVTVHIPRA